MYILLPLSFLISLIGWIILRQVEDEVESRMQREVQIVGRALRMPIQRAIMENSENQIQEALNSIFTIGSVYGAFVYDRNGRLIAKVGRGGDDPRYQSYIISLLEGREDTGDYVRFEGDTVYSAFIPLTDVFENPIGLIQINRDRSEIITSVGHIRLQAIFLNLWLVLGITVIVLVGYYVAQGRGIRRLQRSIRKIEEGDHNHRAALSGPREISELALGFNRMMDSLNSAREEIRERKAIEEILREQALRNDRLVELGQLAGGIAHELGAPLSVIRGLLRRLKQRYSDQFSEASRETLSGIEAELDRTEAVVQQLLDFGNNKQKRELLDIESLIDQAVQASKPVLDEQGAHIEKSFQGESKAVQGNFMRLEMALRNLIINAAQHAPESGVSILVTFYEAEVAIVVRDCGPGIPEGMENRIFEPFVTAREEGHGLGLALVQKVVREHQGIVRAQNHYRQGAEFRIILPLLRNVSGTNAKSYR